MAKKKYCNRCAHEMWYDETKRRWHCTNQNCVKYKEPPQPEPEPTATEQDETATDSGKE